MSTESPDFTEKPQTTLMVLGKNIGEEWTGERIRKTRHHLSPHGRIDVLGAGVAIREGLADNVVFTITNTAGHEPLTHEEAVASKDLVGEGRPLSPEAELMADHFKRIFPSLSDRVSVQTQSWDTNTDAKEAKKLVKNKTIGERFKLMTVGFHAKRAKFLFNRVRLKPEVLKSEDVLARRKPKFVKAYKESDLYQQEVKKEKRIYIVQRFPFAADIISMITKRSRS